MPSLDYTGHPLFDVGLAAIVAHVDKDSPADLTEGDLDSVADYIDTYYTEQPLMSFLTVSLPNSDFTNPAFRDNPKRRHAYAQRVARSFSSNVPKSDERCVFTGQPALALPLSVRGEENDLPPGKAYRQHIPLLTGENIINFAAWGDHGLPVSGEAILCLQFFPMGCRKCGGRLLGVHSDNPKIILAAAREALHENKKAITLARASGETKLPDAPSLPQTLLIETIVDMDLRQLDARDERQPYSITAYHLTNAGQTSPLDEKSPPLRIYHLPMNIVRFLRKMHHPDYKPFWQELVKRGWERPKLPKGKNGSGKGEVTIATERRRNYLYEDIFRLPENAHSFVGTYLLRVPKRNVSSTDPRSDYSLRRDIGLISWQFTELFLHEVMHMDKRRIEEIRKLGNTLAEYVKEQDDKRFFRKFYELQRGDYFRTELLRASRNSTSRGKAPLFTLDSFCTIFFEADGDTLRLDWRFARDLVFISMLEWLYKHDDRFGEHLSALPEDRESESSSSNDEQ